MDAGITTAAFFRMKMNLLVLPEEKGSFGTFFTQVRQLRPEISGLRIMTVAAVKITARRKMAVRFPGPSTALKGMILFTGTRPQLSAAAMPVSFCSMSLPHFSLEDAAVVFGSHAEGRGVLKNVFAPLQFLDLRFFHQITGIRITSLSAA